MKFYCTNGLYILGHSVVLSISKYQVLVCWVLIVNVYDSCTHKQGFGDKVPMILTKNECGGEGVRTMAAGIYSVTWATARTAGVGEASRNKRWAGKNAVRGKNA